MAKPKKFNDVPRALKNNARLLYVVNFTTTAGFTVPVYLLFGMQHLHLSYFQAGSFFLTSWILSLALDFVGGVFADKYGRKNTFLIGVLLQIIGGSAFVFIQNYPLLLVASAIVGLGMALASNTLTALMYEHAHELGQKAYYQHVNGTTGFFSYTSRIVGSLVGGFVFTIHPTIPYALVAVFLVIALIAGSKMVFPHRAEQQIERAKKVKVTTETWSIFKSNPALIKFTLILGLLCILGDYTFTYYQPYYLERGADPMILGLLFASISLLSALGSLLMRKLPDIFSPHAISSLGLVAVAITTLILMIFQLPIAYLAPLVLASISGFSFANINLYVNQHTPNRVRSSVLSVVTSLTGVGSAVGIVVALQFAEHLSAQVILSIAFIGALVGLVLNTAIRIKEKPIRETIHST